MKIWIVTIGEPLPIENSQLRPHRTGMLAKFLNEKTTHEITWWTSDFNHFNKKSIFGRDINLEIGTTFKLKILNGGGYKTNVSLRRVLDHYIIARKFLKCAKNETMKPDLIVCSFPTLLLSHYSVNLAKKWCIPCLLDYRDMWPEVYEDYFPYRLKPFVSVITAPIHAWTNRVLRAATGIVSISPTLLNIAVSKAKRSVSINDKSLPLGYYTSTVSDSSRSLHKKIPGLANQNKFRIVFFGTFGYQYDFETILRAAKVLQIREFKDIEFILCGSGDLDGDLKLKANELNNVVFPGYLNASEIRELSFYSKFGMCPYIKNDAYMSTIPGKSLEYMSYGLPVISSLKGSELNRVLNEVEGGGYYYDNDDHIGLTNLLIELYMKNSSELERARVALVNYFKNNFSFEKIYSEYVEHLEFIVLKNEKV